jgi:hypothetical protein
MEAPPQEVVEPEKAVTQSTEEPTNKRKRDFCYDPEDLVDVDLVTATGQVIGAHKVVIFRNLLLLKRIAEDCPGEQVSADEGAEGNPGGDGGGDGGGAPWWRWCMRRGWRLVPIMP